MRLAAVAPVRSAIGTDHALLAILLQSLLAVGAFHAGVDDAADGYPVADLVPRNAVTQSSDRADDFVARNHGICRTAPVVSRSVEV